MESNLSPELVGGDLANFVNELMAHAQNRDLPLSGIPHNLLAETQASARNQFEPSVHAGSCAVFEKLTICYLLDLLSPEGNEILKSHIDSCTNCRINYIAFKDTFEALLGSRSEWFQVLMKIAIGRTSTIRQAGPTRNPPKP
jgi:hypothetical protein